MGKSARHKTWEDAINKYYQNSKVEKYLYLVFKGYNIFDAHGNGFEESEIVDRELSLEEVFNQTYSPFVEVKLNDNYIARVYSDGIVVGCQEFDIDALKKLNDAWEKIKAN
jgi:hypothetical protein